VRSGLSLTFISPSRCYPKRVQVAFIWARRERKSQCLLLGGGAVCLTCRVGRGPCPLIPLGPPVSSPSLVMNHSWLAFK
jgi:hypothetical protein